MVKKRVALADLLAPAFWQGLAPHLHVDNVDFMEAQRPFDLPEAVGDSLEALLLDEGYFQLPAQDWGLPLADMAGLVNMLDQIGLPLPFCFMYDEFWCAYVKLHHILGRLLDPGYLRLPDFWAWRVDPAKGQSGWRPHRDKGYQALLPDGRPKSLTIWLPLTDATTLNGCMYVVPAAWDPTYGTVRDAEWEHQPGDVRALPAAAGSVLCWNQALLHWGSRSSRRAADPRISIAFEFQRGDVPAFNQPLTPPDRVPNFLFRLRLIGKQILQYQHMYPLASEMATLAEQLTAMEHSQHG